MIRSGTLEQCIADLERAGLIRVPDEVRATLEVAEIQRRVYRSGGPAVLFENCLAGCRFPMVSNLFGTIQAPISSSVTRSNTFAT